MWYLNCFLVVLRYRLKRNTNICSNKDSNKESGTPHFDTYFISENGIKWEKIDSQENPMAKNVYIGFAYTSHDNSKLGKVVFSNYKLKADKAKLHF